MHRRITACLLACFLLFSASAERTRPTVAPVQRRAVIRVAGDFVIHDSLIRSAQALGGGEAYDFSPMLSEISHALADADFTFANVDGALSGLVGRDVYSGYPQFNTPESLLTALKRAGVDGLTMANNHMLDRYYDGLLRSLDNAEAAGLFTVGASRTQEARQQPCLLELCGIRIGIVNYTCSLNSIDRMRGLNPNAMAFAVHAVKNSDIEDDIRLLRQGGAEIILCFMHWGTEYMKTPDSTQLALAKRLARAGADVIIGGHPHVVQRADWLTETNQFGEEQRTLCIYSLGNFLSGQRQSGQDGGVILELTLEETDGKIALASFGYISTWVWRTGTERAGYDYCILPVNQYRDNPPKDMTTSDLRAMLRCDTRNREALASGSAPLEELPATNPQPAVP